MSEFSGNFRKMIQLKKLKIAVVGLGYVGLPLAVEFAKKGFSVLGIDVDKDRIARISRKESYITDVATKELRQIIQSGRFRAESGFRSLKDIDVILICVPTPLKRKNHPNISYIKSAVKGISGYLKKNCLVILESTTYPGTTEEVILPLLEVNGRKHGQDFYLCFSPERIDPGNLKYPVNKIPKVIGGITSEATSLGVLVYKSIVNQVVSVSSPRVAETVKLLENTFRLINIGLIDELAMMANKMNIDIWEVVEAAKTKPFGFMPFYPGPGVGGHCLDKNEIIYAKEGSSLKVFKMPDFIKHIEKTKDNVEVLSFDPIKRRSVFKPVTAASARPFNGQMVDITTEDGRHLKVTDLHPMFVYNNNKWGLKYAKDLKPRDCLPISLELPRFTQISARDQEIDILENIQLKGTHLIDKIRVKTKGFSWRQYANEIKTILRQENHNKIPDICWDYLSDDILPLKYFYKLDKLVTISRDNLKLVTGRGPGYSEIPAKICLDSDFCRLIGYYLSEGCHTKDKSSRIRFTFNRSEKEYIKDVVNILSKLGIRTSIYESKIWKASCIKVSSDIFGFVIADILECGKNSKEMKIPGVIFALDKENKKSLIAGIFRGDACVEHFFGKWRYRKNEHEYFHNVNTAHISFFTSSRKLFQQLIVLLNDLSIVATFKKRKYTISIFGYKQLEFFKGFFDGAKKDILERYLALNKNRPRNKTFKKIGKFAVVRVKDISFSRGDWVYSIETQKPHSFVTSFGIAVHNCIPKDPLYLYWKAKKFGFKSSFIKLASGVIRHMPFYVVKRVREILRQQGLKLNQAKVLVVGVTYKKDILDLRQSPSLDIIEILRKEAGEVSYYDPLIPYLKLKDIDLESVDLGAGKLNYFDCVIIATDHTKVDYGLILKNARAIFDSRNIYRGIENKKIHRL
ncbi:MAG: nucleotide sugar dehydrogenase [Candidatus Omnitrophota bacterium]